MNLPSLLRGQGVTNPVVFFNHIPMPDADTLEAIGEESRIQFRSYIRELKHADVVLFQSDITANRFLDALGHKGLDLDPYETAQVDIAGEDVLIGNFPISIDVPDITKKANMGTLVSQGGMNLRDRMVADNIFIDFARADYSKGLLERANAFKQMMDERPELKGKAQLVMGAEPSRTDIPAYIDYVRDVKAITAEINADQTLWVDGQPPIVLLNERVDHEDVVQLLRNDRAGQRKIGAITAWRDGMNLVCKEFMMAQDTDNAGVLILSNGTGAAHEKGFRRNAVTYDPQQDKSDNLVNAMTRAIDMSQEEANRRATAGQAYLKEFDLGRWALETVGVMKDLQSGGESPELEIEPQTTLEVNA